jgi:hypothetical protein
MRKICSDNRSQLYVLFFVEQLEHRRDFEFELDASSGRLHITSNLMDAIIDKVRTP